MMELTIRNFSEAIPDLFRNVKRSPVWFALAAAPLFLTSCSTQTPIEGRVAPNYAGHPIRVAILAPPNAHLRPSVWEGFLDELSHSLQACGLSVERLNQITPGVVAIPRGTADTALLIRSISYYAERSGALDGEKFDIEVTELPAGPIVWHGTLTITNPPFFLDTRQGERPARDLVARLAVDGILKSCPAKP